MRTPWTTVSLALLPGLVIADYEGSGAEFASSCQSALWAWSAASQSYGTANPRTDTVSSQVIATITSTALAGTVLAKEFVTLCDGHPRVLGNASFQSTTTISTTIPIRDTRTTAGTAYPTPIPCSINNNDCANLWSTFYSNYDDTKKYTGTLGASPAPPCATTGTSNPLTAASCTAPFLAAKEARLLYWAVRTIDNEANTSIFCNKTAIEHPLERDSQLPATITASPTISGQPNTFVTGSLTITSPTIGIFFSELKRADSCGPTVSSTIVLAPPEQLSSARGVRAAYKSLPFNFADLNWKCRDSKNGTFTIADYVVNDECYQDVQADAYFGGQDKWKDLYYRYSSDLIIANDYHPAIYPPENFYKEATRTWGPDILWLVQGVFDPPLALDQVKTIAGPTVPNGETRPTVTSTSQTGALTTPASPATAASSQAPATALPVEGSTTPSSATSTTNVSQQTSGSTPVSSVSQSGSDALFAGAPRVAMISWVIVLVLGLFSG